MTPSDNLTSTAPNLADCGEVAKQAAAPGCKPGGVSQDVSETLGRVLGRHRQLSSKRRSDE